MNQRELTGVGRVLTERLKEVVMISWLRFSILGLVAVPLTANAGPDCNAAHGAARDGCGKGYDKCFCAACPTTAKCGGTTYGCTVPGKCRNDRAVCNDNARKSFNACARAAQSQTVAQSAGENAAAFDAATSRVRDAQKWLPGSMRASTDQVVGAVGELKGKNVKMTRGVWGRVVDAVRAILRGPKALAEAIKKLSPVEVLKMEEQKAWTGN